MFMSLQDSSVFAHFILIEHVFIQISRNIKIISFEQMLPFLFLPREEGRLTLVIQRLDIGLQMIFLYWTVTLPLNPAPRRSAGLC